MCGIFIYDLETDGLITTNDKTNDEFYPAILQIGIINYCTKEIIYDDYVFSSIAIPDFITKINNIDNKIIKNSPTLEETKIKLQHIFYEYKKIIVVAHNGDEFDHKIMKYYNLFPSHLEITFLDSKKMIPKFYPNLDNYSLSKIYEHFFKEPIKNIHSSIGDTKALIKIFNHLNIKFNSECNECSK